MIILGLDPGFARCGFGIIDAQGSGLRHVTHGCIETKKEETFASRLLILGNELEILFAQYTPDRVVIEKIFFTKNIKTAIQVAHARGVIFYVCEKHGIKIIELTPTSVKMGLTGFGRADKQQIMAMVKLQLGLKEMPKPDDAADALAVAICGSAIKFSNC